MAEETATKEPEYLDLNLDDIDLSSLQKPPAVKSDSAFDDVALEDVDLTSLNVPFDHTLLDTEGSFASDELRAKWDKKGEIGFLENTVFQDDISNNHAYAVNFEHLPYFNAIDLYEKGSILYKAERLKSNSYGVGEEKQRQSDYDEVRKFALKMEEMNHRGLSFGAKAHEMVGQSSAFMFEFLTSLGVYPVVKKGGKEVVKETIKRSLKEALVAGAKSGVKALGREAKRTAVFMSHRVALNYQDRRINQQLAITNKGQLLINEAADNPATLFYKAFTDVWIENITEVIGGELLGRAAGGIGRKLPKGFIDDFVKGVPDGKFKSLMAGGWNALTKSQKRVAFNGVLQEYGEERLGALLKAYTGVDDRDISLLDKTVQALFPDGEQVLLELGLFSAFGVLSSTSATLSKKWKEQGFTDEQIKERIVTSSETERDAMLDEMVESGEISQVDLKKGPPHPMETPLESQSPLDNVTSQELSTRVKEQGFDVEGRSLDELKELAGTTKAGETLDPISQKALEYETVDEFIESQTPVELDAESEGDFGAGEYPMAARGEWYGESDYKSQGGSLIEMTPEEFLTKAKALEMDEATRENIEDLKDHIKRGRKLDPLTLYEIDIENVKASDGRRRAIAAQELGIEKVPVVSYAEKGATTEELTASFAKAHEAKENLKLDIDPGDVYELTTRQIKKTTDYKDFRKHAEENFQDKDINPSSTSLGHVSFTAERLAEFMDDGIGGKMWQEMIKPVYKSAEKVVHILSEVSNKVRSFKVLEGSSLDRDAFLYAEGKIETADPKAKELANYIRGQYDSLLVELNAVRKKMGAEPIPKRQDYITHLNEMSILSEILGIDRMTINNRIRKLKKHYIEEKGYEEGRAWEAAKREVDGAKGVNQYIDAKDARFDFVKQRLGDYQANPSIIRSFKAYLPQAINYIHQAENVAKNKAFKDVLPPNAKEMMRKWNTEAVAGRPNVGWIGNTQKRILSAVRGQLGANIILGNIGTVAMQLTSFPQVIATAGVRNTFHGIYRRLASYISGNNNFNQSQVKALRDLGIDMGLGDSFIDQALIAAGKYDSVKDAAARSRQAIDFGRKFLQIVMEKADQFTVGATYEAFYHKGIKEGLDSEAAADYANIMTGKTQANYFKQALPMFLNSFEGKTIAQFGTYTMNQFQFFKRDFGKDFNFNEKSKRSARSIFKQFVKFTVTAYLIDSLGQLAMSRQPYDIKSLIDEIMAYIDGDSDEKATLAATKDTAFGYIPFLGSTKYKTMPPLFEFSKDSFNAVFESSDQKRESAREKITNKWSYNVLLPYGGNQLRKTMQGIETSEDIDLPFAKDVSKDHWEVKENVDRVRSWLFGGYASEAAQKYFENRDKREFIKRKFELSGSITSKENIEKLKKMTDKEFTIYTAGYAESTMKAITRKTGRAPLEESE